MSAGVCQQVCVSRCVSAGVFQLTKVHEEVHIPLVANGDDKNWCNMVKFLSPHNNLSSMVLNQVKFMNHMVRQSVEQSI